MRHHIFEEASSYSIALLSKHSAFNKAELINNYVTPLMMGGVKHKEVIAFTADYNENNKAPVTFIKEYLGKLMPVLRDLGVKHLLVGDAAYFKVLAGVPTAEKHLGYAMPCKLKGFEHMHVVLTLNYQQLIFNPELQAKLDMSLKTLLDHRNGCYQPPGVGIIHSAEYPRGYQAVAEALKKLHAYPALTGDIEAFSLDFWDAGIGTMAFAWDEHNGMSFPVDYDDSVSHEDMVKGFHGFHHPRQAIRELLKQFFIDYKGSITWHNAAYDVKNLIYNLWMKDLSDTEGLLEGLEVMTRHMDDTKIIAYLATNTTAGNVLGLKSLAHEFAGNWAVEVKDIRKVPLDKLLEYNLVDCLSTWFVKKKYWPIMVRDKQLDLYTNLMMPSQRLLLQTELTGMPLSKTKVAQVKAKLEKIRDEQASILHNSSVIKTLNLIVQTKAMEAANSKLKVKQHPIEKFAGVVFNPNSGPQTQRLLYELMGLPVIDYTETKQPATGSETIEKLLNHTDVPEYKAILTALIEFQTVATILQTFIPAFEKAIEKGTGDIVWLHGSFNIGGTVSGRLSSSDPNLQNIPTGGSGSDAKQLYGKLIKDCFVAPEGWLFCGADFNSLEDYISALTTKDPNKLKVYTDGFDGHCLRAYAYFPEQLPGIINTVESINSIAKAFKTVRQESKAPTFLLTYGGTYHGMMKNLGWSLEKAQRIETNYKTMYKASMEYIDGRLRQATKDGYVEVAFGLRVRTPLLAQVVWGTGSMPHEASAEGRTAGNAMGQSYGLLNNRAAQAFQHKVWKSPYRLDILPVALIHDAIYILVRDRPDVVEWANKHLITEMQWQNLPEIQHPTVKLGAALDIFWPSWATATTLPNGADQQTIINLCKATRDEVMGA